MQEIRYSRAKLWGLAIVCAHIALFMFALFLNPQYHMRGPYSLFFNGSLGHFITLPLVTLTCIIVTARCVIVAIGPAAAIVTDKEGATVNTIWRSHRVAWRDLLGVRLEARKVRRTMVYSLKFDRCAGGTISLPLGALTFPVHGYHYERLAEALSRTHLSAINRVPTAPPKAPIPVAHNVVQPKTIAAPLRPTFGRKNA